MEYTYLDLNVILVKFKAIWPTDSKLSKTQKCIKQIERGKKIFGVMKSQLGPFPIACLFAWGRQVLCY